MPDPLEPRSVSFREAVETINWLKAELDDEINREEYAVRYDRGVDRMKAWRVAVKRIGRALGES